MELLQLCSESAIIPSRNHTANNAIGSSYIAGECISQIASGYINDIPRLYLSWSAEIMKSFVVRRHYISIPGQNWLLDSIVLCQCPKYGIIA